MPIAKSRQPDLRTARAAEKRSAVRQTVALESLRIADEQEDRWTELVSELV
ncbi:MAG: hypothetical protein NTV34_16990 [Proteobacteria bacterium]|nr:hypothetical protein [Pseudomonadota bacterium]